MPASIFPRSSFGSVGRNFPEQSYSCLDILDADVDVPQFDYVVMNGIFTEKRSLSFDEMWRLRPIDAGTSV